MASQGLGVTQSPDLLTGNRAGRLVMHWLVRALAAFATFFVAAPLSHPVSVAAAHGVIDQQAAESGSSIGARFAQVFTPTQDTLVGFDVLYHCNQSVTFTVREWHPIGGGFGTFGPDLFPGLSFVTNVSSVMHVDIPGGPIPLTLGAQYVLIDVAPSTGFACVGGGLGAAHPLVQNGTFPESYLGGGGLHDNGLLGDTGWEWNAFDFYFVTYYTVSDSDNDGVLGANDLCPNAPEDADGVQDNDGCPETDADSDGIDDQVDEAPEVVSNGFSDMARGGRTAGEIVSVPNGMTVKIVDHPNSGRGIRVTVTGAAGQRATLQLDGKASTIRLRSPGTYTITDPDTVTTVEVEQDGPAEVELVVAGRTTVVEIGEGEIAEITETFSGGTLVGVAVTALEGTITVNGMEVVQGSSLTVGTLSAIRLTITRVPRQPTLRAFVLTATFVPGTGSDGLLFRTEAVELRIGAYAETIPAGSFRRDAQGRFWFTGKLDGVLLAAVITPLQAGRFRVDVAGTGAILAGTVNPVTVGLAIGDDGATAMTTVKGLP
jgi:hypothetical protein